MKKTPLQIVLGKVRIYLTRKERKASVFLNKKAIEILFDLIRYAP